MRVAYSVYRTVHETPLGTICAIHWPEQGGAYKLFPACIDGFTSRNEAVVTVTSWTPLAIERTAFDPETAVEIYLKRRAH